MFIFDDVAKVLPLVLLPHYVVAKIAKLSGYKKCKYQLQYYFDVGAIKWMLSYNYTD